MGPYSTALGRTRYGSATRRTPASRFGSRGGSATMRTSMSGNARRRRRVTNVPSNAASNTSSARYTPAKDSTTRKGAASSTRRSRVIACARPPRAFRCGLPVEPVAAEDRGWRAILDSNQWPWASETHQKSLNSPSISGGHGPFVGHVTAIDALRRHAFALLEAIDSGAPIGAPARALAVSTLRVTAPDTAPWWKAIELLEGGPLRARRAVDLAGQVLDALGTSKANHHDAEAG